MSLKLQFFDGQLLLEQFGSFNTESLKEFQLVKLMSSTQKYFAKIVLKKHKINLH